MPSAVNSKACWGELPLSHRQSTRGGDLYGGLGGEQGEEEERGGEEVFHDRAVDCDIR